MKNHAQKLLIALALTLLSTINYQLSTVFAQGTAFTYQGQLQNNGSLANGSYNLTFALYTNSTGGTAVVGPLTNNGVAVSSNGLFTVTIDFGSAPWNGQTNWLQIGVATNGSSGFTTLTPLQELTPAPYAIYAESAGSLQDPLAEQNSNGAPNVILGSSANYISNGVVGATIGGGGATNYYGENLTNQVTADFGTVGGGGGNTAGGYSSTVGGGTGNTASDSATVGGGNNNTASNYNTTIGGGLNNIAGGEYAVVGGGYDNIASGVTATVVGGYNNNASGYYSVVGGYGNKGSATAAVVAGYNNTASNEFATVPGGRNNVAGDTATVGGGIGNSATGIYSTVPGGNGNTAGGNNGFAAGQFATAPYSGDFVWADTSSFDPYSATVADQFAVRASGGILFAGDLQLSGGAAYHNFSLSGGNSLGYLYGSYPALGDGIHLGYNYYYDAGGGGHVFNHGGATSRISVGYGTIDLAVGGVNTAPSTVMLQVSTSGVCANGTISNCSDRNAKQDLAPVDPAQILQRALELPVTKWSYKIDAATRHIGPMAQDFYAAFAVGSDDRHIATIDEGGVALAAIQGLNEKMEAGNVQSEAGIRKAEARIQNLEAENAELKARLERLELIITTKSGRDN